MNPDHFYVTLPSNSSLKIFPENTLTNFKTNLPAPIRFKQEDRWEVGISKIVLPYYWKNVNRTQVKLTVTPPRVRAPLNVKIQSGFYTNEELAKEITSLLGRFGEVAYLKVKRKFRVSLTGGLKLGINKNLADLMGFKVTADESEFIEIAGKLTAPRHSGLGTFYNLYVYSDVIHPRIVGDAMAPLLRNVPLEGDPGKNRIIHHNYTTVHYFPVKKNYIEQIEMDIRLGTGIEVPFDRGTVIVTLHFRKV